jgi:hypothetical protein
MRVEGLPPLLTSNKCQRDNAPVGPCVDFVATIFPGNFRAFPPTRQRRRSIACEGETTLPPYLARVFAKRASPILAHCEWPKGRSNRRTRCQRMPVTAQTGRHSCADVRPASHRWSPKVTRRPGVRFREPRPWPGSAKLGTNRSPLLSGHKASKPPFCAVPSCRSSTSICGARSDAIAT